jgi:hypothetical protein
MSFLLHVVWNDDVCVFKNAVFRDCSSLSALTYNRLTDVQKFITLKPFIVPVSVNTCWSARKLIYISHVYAQTRFGS